MDLLLLLFAYAFLGWVMETVVATIKEKGYRNRGFATGPFCFIYGIAGTTLTVFLQDLKGDLFFLFLGSALIATAIEWIAGKFLERMNLQRWWDYTNMRFNFNGYICLRYSVLWGILGVLAVRYGNRLILGIAHLLPDLLRHVLIWILVVIALFDVLGSYASVNHFEEIMPRIFAWNNWLKNFTERLGTRFSNHVEKRLNKVYSMEHTKKEAKAKAKNDRVSLAELFWLMVIGAFLGDIVETIFCRITAGIWMSRTSLVWGMFSMVWGLALAIATALLYKERNKSDRSIFLFGTFLGGAYEYICSVFTEIMFGQVFWDYSKIPFNLGGRINLLYCFFWGFAAVVWIKAVYPKASALVTWIRKKTGRWLTIALFIFMVVNCIVSMLALNRYGERNEGIAPDSAIERFIDERFPDERMERIYPNSVMK